MIYIVQRWPDEDDIRIVLATTNRELAYSVKEKLERVYPDDYIDVFEFADGVINTCYEQDLKETTND